MKLLLTSAGFENKTIVNALGDLSEKPLPKSKAVYIPTASNVEAGDKWWLIDDYTKCKAIGLKEFDILDFSAVEKQVWLERYQNADILIFGGGNTSHLMQEIYEHGLYDEIPKLLNQKIYVGVSAGSHVASVDLYSKLSADLFDESYTVVNDDKGLGLADLWVVPHVNSEYFENLTWNNVEKVAENVSCPVYALDDNSAVVVDGDRIEVVSEGKWKKFG